MVKRLVVLGLVMASGCSLIVGDEPRRLAEDAGVEAGHDGAAPSPLPITEPTTSNDAAAAADACSPSAVCTTAAASCYARCDEAWRTCASECDDGSECNRCALDRAKCEGECQKKCADCTAAAGCPAACSR
jgi:hypothetical protein